MDKEHDIVTGNELREYEHSLPTQSGTWGDQSPDREHSVFIIRCPVRNFWPAGHETLTTVPTIVSLVLTTRNTIAGHLITVSQSDNCTVAYTVLLMMMMMMMTTTMMTLLITAATTVWCLFVIKTLIFDLKVPPKRLLGAETYLWQNVSDIHQIVRCILRCNSAKQSRFISTNKNLSCCCDSRSYCVRRTV